MPFSNWMFPESLELKWPVPVSQIGSGWGMYNIDLWSSRFLGVT